MPPPADLSPEAHAQLDEITRSELSGLSGLSIETHASLILKIVLTDSMEAYETVWPIHIPNLATLKTYLLDEEIRALLESAHSTGEYSEIRKRPEFHKKVDNPLNEPSPHFQNILQATQRKCEVEVLRKAYAKPFRGTFADDFLAHLSQLDQDIQRKKISVYAKALPVVQSSATGKSRLLSETGRKIFTLPVCLRAPEDPGYPPSDEQVYEYFLNIRNSDNDLSLSSHIAIACFLGAAYKTMLSWLQRAQGEQDYNPEELHRYWHRLMEEDITRNDRNTFFSEVVSLANTRKNNAPSHGASPKRGPQTKSSGVEVPSAEKKPDILDVAKTCYEKYIHEDITNLMDFINGLYPNEKQLFVAYIDEAHNLGGSYWILLRLLGYLPEDMKMWYAFLGTKSSLAFFRPPPVDLRSLRLHSELKKLLPPYIAVGFDQNAIFTDKTPERINMGTLHSIKRLSLYGRPIWNALFREGEEDSLVALAAFKLTNGCDFDFNNKYHVLAVLSQLLCVDLVLASSEAMKLADRSVANHMRILTGFSSDGTKFYTCCPSEPLLALGAFTLLHREKDSGFLGNVLNTFSGELCAAGLVEKGRLGELASRLLLLVARDMAAPAKLNGFARDLLKPILLMDFLDELFNGTWCDTHRDAFTAAFGSTYVNFTHWILTRDFLPEEPTKNLLANLWARGAALQCCFNQESLDLLIVTYSGNVTPSETFNIAKLSAVVVQVKYKAKADTKAEPAIRPLGIYRDLSQPLPYLAILLELGNESCHQETSTQFQVTTSSPLVNGKFEDLQQQWISALQQLKNYKDEQLKTKKRKGRKDAQQAQLQEALEKTRVAMDAYNRYTISVRGASSGVYGVLKKANIEKAFATLLSVTMPSPSPIQDPTIQYMKPLDRLDLNSAHNAWMFVYGRDSEDDGAIDEDSDSCL